MTDRSQEDARLPPEWLPEPQPAQDAPEWDAKVRRIMAAAEAEVADSVPVRPGAWAVFGQLWKPAAALAAAAAAALLLVTDRAPAVGDPPASLSLTVVATEGDPTALGGTAEAAPHPVLALLAAEPLGQEDP